VDNAYVTDDAATDPQEDFAETALIGYAMTFYPERFPDADRAAIQAQIPRRLFSGGACSRRTGRELRGGDPDTTRRSGMC
jgi:hypothetical protein